MLKIKNIPNKLNNYMVVFLFFARSFLLSLLLLSKIQLSRLSQQSLYKEKFKK